MEYKVFNQNDYPNSPYQGPGFLQATIKSGGCGPTCAAMIVCNLTPTIVDPVFMADYAKKKGARVFGGTDMNVLAKELAKDFDLSLDTTDAEEVLLAHLKAGGMAIANVSGDRSGYRGVFSDKGHYIVVAGVATGGDAIVLDPQYYEGKYNRPGRKGKVAVSGKKCICSLNVLGDDTKNRAPAYYLFGRKEKKPMPTPTPETWKLDIVNEAKREGLIDEYHNPDAPASVWFVLKVALSVLKILRKGGK